MTLKRIFRIVRHPTTIKIVGVLVIVGFFFILPTFAENTATSTSSLDEVRKGLNNILSLCSRGWVILAILAGKLMTNDLVYGSILHMDIYLRKIRNIMKNFANFALVGIVLYQIINNLVGKKNMDIKKIITNTLVAGILIQASRFLVGALVDLSTIATSAIGAFPSSFLQTDAALKDKMIKSLDATPKRYLISNTGDVITPIGNDLINGSDTRDEILPTYNSVSGPLIYLGFSVFKFQNYIDVSGSDHEVGLTISFLLRVILIGFYTIGLALLFIANIIRVVFLRIFIIGMPLIILLAFFGKDGGLSSKTSSGGIGKYFKFSVLLDLVFKPVIFVAGFSMILILVVSMQNIMKGTLPKSFNGVTISVESGASRLHIAEISDIQVMENGVFGENVNMAGQVKEVGQTIFVNLILFFLTAFLMWQFIKISAISGEGPIADIMGGERGIIKTLERMAMTLPILPLSMGTGDQTIKSLSFGQMKNALSKTREQILGGMGLNKRGEFGEYDFASNRFTTQEEKFRDFITGGTNWKAADYESIAKQAVAGGDLFGKTQELAKERKGGFVISTNTGWLELLKKWIQQNEATAQQKGFTRREGETADEYFKNDRNRKALDNRKALYNALGGNGATGKSYTNNAPSRDELKNMPFFATKKTGNTLEK